MYARQRRPGECRVLCQRRTRECRVLCQRRARERRVLCHCSWSGCRGYDGGEFTAHELAYDWSIRSISLKRHNNICEQMDGRIGIYLVMLVVTYDVEAGMTWVRYTVIPGSVVCCVIVSPGWVETMVVVEAGRVCVR